jgi:hypothetical protein
VNAQETKTLLEKAFRARFADSKYAPGREDYYDFEVRNLSTDGTAFELRVTFKRNERYCCMEPGCHFGFWTAEHWQRTRAELARVGLAALPPLTIRKLCAHVEKDALFFGLRFRGDTSVHPSDERSYEVGPFCEAHPAKPLAEEPLPASDV